MTDFPSISETNRKRLLTNVIKFLQYDAELNVSEKKESIEIAIQCLESAYLIDSSKAEYSTEEFKTFLAPYRDPEDIFQEAENYKSNGNDFMKNEKYADATEQYNRAINLCPTNAVYYCNRAAAFTRLNKHQEALADCKEAIKLDPNYDKAYGRLGIVYSNLKMHKEARDAYKKALTLDPKNSTYEDNFKFCEKQILENLASDNRLLSSFNEFITNPNLMNVASELLNTSRVCDFMSGIFNVREENTASDVDPLSEVQRLVEQARSGNNSLGLDEEPPNNNSKTEEHQDDAPC